MTTTAPAPVVASAPEQQVPLGGRDAPESWATFLPRLLARTALMTVGAMLFWAVLPALFGWHATTVMSDSMAPRLLRGDIVVSMPISGHRVVPGQVALFDDPDHAGRLRFHRVIDVGPGHVLTTKGDANASPDSTPVDPSAVHGVGVLRVPYLAYPIVWLREGRLVPLAVVGTALATALALALPRGTTPRADGRATTRGCPSRPHRRAVRAIAIAALLAGATAAVAGTVATPAHSSFTSRTAAPAATLTAASAFPCFTAAPATPAFLDYRFAETTGTSAADSSGNGRTGALHGGVTHVAGSCAPGDAPALAFDGSSGYVSSPSAGIAPNTFTLSLWFSTTSTTGGKLIGFGTAQTGASALYDRHLYLSNDGRLNFGVYPGLFVYDTITSPRSYNDGAWHLATATLSAAGMHLYVDGVEVASNPSVTSGELFLGGYWRIGYDTISSIWPNAPTSDYFAGRMSGVAVYTTAFSAAQVAAAFAAGR
jgi:signal peptidase I